MFKFLLFVVLVVNSILALLCIGFSTRNVRDKKKYLLGLCGFLCYTATVYVLIQSI